MIRTRSLSFIQHAAPLHRRNLQLKSLLAPSSFSSSHGLPPPSIGPRWSSASPSRTSLSSTPPLSRTTIRCSSSHSNDPHQQAIEKAQRLHAELNEMMAAQKAAHKAAREKPYSSSLKEFLLSSQPQLFNIFFAFVCVLLAYQIHALRKGYKTLLDRMHERDRQLDRWRSLLRTLCDLPNHESIDPPHEESFSFALSQKCTAAVRSLLAQSDAKPGYLWIVGRKLAAADPVESAHLAEVLRGVIAREMKEAVGDAVWSEEEKAERRMVELQADVGERRMGGLVEVLQQVHEEDLVDGDVLEGEEGGKVKRMRYAI